MKTRALISILLVGICAIGYSQTNFAEMPKFTPQSPEAAAFNKYGEYPVSLFTGVPDISIPLFEIKTSKFIVPITLNYHASGIKVNEFAGWVGLGWSVNEGGRISRTVRGREDEAYQMNVRDPASIDPLDNADFLYLEQLEKLSGSFDVEPDIYNYSFPGKSGRFLFLDHNQIMIPYCGVKVAAPNNRTKLFDEAGNIYFYDQKDHPSSDYPNEMSAYDPVSSWLLTKMVDHGRTDSIMFSYQSAGAGCLGMDYVDYVVVDDMVMNQVAYGAGIFSSGISVPNCYNIITYGSELVPSEIAYSRGLIRFISSTTNRQDRPDWGSGTEFRSLDRIEIYSIDNLSTPKKSIKFYHSYFINGTSKRLRLDSIRILDNNLLLIQRYKFNYSESYKLPDYNSKKKDFWGYYNGKNNDMLLPKMTIPFTNDDGSQIYKTIGTNLIDGRDPDPLRMQAYILNKITYPTGGYTLFEYETNRYLDNGTPKYAGGLRIVKIMNFNDDGSCITKTYKYGENESGYGNFNSFLSNLYYSTPPLSVICTNCADNCEACISTKRTRTFTSTPNTDLNPYDGSPVVYSTVTEYYGDENVNSGKIVYNYTYERDERVAGMGVDNSTIISKFFRRGLLDSKTVYCNIGGVYKKKSAVKNYYFKYSVQNPFCSIRAVKVKQYEGEFWQKYKEFVYNWARTNPVFYGDNLLLSTHEYTYDINDATKFVVKSTSYNYNNSVYTQVSTITENDSKLNTAFVRTFRYPTDFAGNSIYEAMSAKNLINYQIEENHYLNGTTPLVCKRTNYSLFNDRFYAPSSVEYKKGSNPWETRIRYYAYNSKGNVLSLSKEGDIKTNYLWGYKDELPVAEVIGSDYNTIYNLLTTTERTSLYQYPSDTEVRTIIQKIRTNFQNSNVMVSTYTHKPMIGLTSSTDPNGKTTYYEYDPFGRLKNIKDQDLVLMKEFNYHYKE